MDDREIRAVALQAASRGTEAGIGGYAKGLDADRILLRAEVFARYIRDGPSYR